MVSFTPDGMGTNASVEVEAWGAQSRCSILLGVPCVIFSHNPLLIQVAA